MSDQRKFQLNVKFGGGYEAPLLNIEGDTQDEFRENVAFAVDNATDIVRAATLFQGIYNVEKPQDNPPPAPQGGQTKSWSNSGSTQAAPAAAPAGSSQPGGPPPSCRHGEMRWRPPGVSQRTNKPYKGFWSCPGPRNDQCETVNG